MIILKEETQPLVEMAQFKGFGITIEVRSDDHGRFGNKESPAHAHAHVIDNQGKKNAQIVLASINPPTKPEDIIWHRTDNPSTSLGLKIIKLVNSKSKSAEKAGRSGIVWQSIMEQWFNFHGD